MASETTEQERSKFQKYLDKNLWPLIIIGILTATFAMNMVLVSLAMQNPPELMTEQYYEKGANLKQLVGEKQATARTGWKVTAHVATEDNLLVVLSIVDAAGLPCDSIVGTCSLYRPSDKHLDQDAKMILPMGNGQYAVNATLPLAHGAWECVTDLSLGEKRYRDRVSFFVN